MIRSEEEIAVKLEDKIRATNSLKAMARDAKNKTWLNYVTQMGS